MMNRILNDSADTEALGAEIAGVATGGEVIYLVGELGAGKTTWVRGFLHALGHTGKVKSPTYTLIEAYDLSEQNIYHFDLYRINDPDELEGMGIRDYFDGRSICLVEWPECGRGVLPGADLVISLSYTETGREAEITAGSESGQAILNQI